ncbi:MAG: DUF1304 domain-containing protein [Bdellovibrionaceae bacterium]|nr:DUF1304 domain-containing protein [Pseudobdellovibrionaceae bacterium]
MNTAANIFVILVALLHCYFLVLEMFLWTKPKGLKIFGQTLAQAKASAVLAANQGLYNGFLASGLFWSLIHSSPDMARELKYFFLGCVVVAGLYGGFTVSKKIAIVQATPALLGILFVYFS